MPNQNPQTSNFVNNGIACDVTSCAYHNGQKRCSAEKVHVNSPGQAQTKEETVCSTFIHAE